MFSRQVNLSIIKGFKSLSSVEMSHTRQSQKNLQNGRLLTCISQPFSASFWQSKEDIYLFSAASELNTSHLTMKGSCHVLVITQSRKLVLHNSVFFFILLGMQVHVFLWFIRWYSCWHLKYSHVCCKQFPVFWVFQQLKNRSTLQHPVGMDFFLCNIYLIK